MSIIKNQEDIQKIKHSALILRSALFQVEKNLKPGITADKLDIIVETFIRDNKGTPAFKGLYGFPNTLITELNEEVVHGLSNKEKIIPENCVVSFDCGVEYEGLYSDMCILLTLGKVTDQEKILVEKTKESLWAGIKEVKAGKVDFKIDKQGIIHASVGKASFSAEKIRDNAAELINTVTKLKPASSKGTYLQSISLSSTMSPGIKVDTGSIAG